MTLPVEKANALINAGRFLATLTQPSLMKRIPRDIRRQAGSRRRHFPTEWEIKEWAEKSLGKEVTDGMIPCKHRSDYIKEMYELGVGEGT